MTNEEAEDLQSLRPFAGERTQQLIDARLKGLSWSQIQDQIGIESGNARGLIRGVKAKAAKQGWSPSHDMNHIVPEGFLVKGVSTYYDKSGQPRAQWVKSAVDRDRQIQLLLEKLESTSAAYRKFKPTAKAKKKAVDQDLLTLITITDFHLGMYAWEAETGDDWDADISRNVFLNAVQDLIDASPASGLGVLNQLGDFLHWDGMLAVTPASGHVLDADTRYGKLVDLSMEIMTQAVVMMLGKFDKVRVIQAEGNHDPSGSIWLRKHLKHVFSNDPRVEVDDTEFPFYAYLHGETMLGFHHGHKIKLAQVHKLFASEPRYRAMWGKATQTYIHTGHLHHERVIEDGGAIAEQHPTLAGRDAYAARGGWISARGAKAITYDKIDGEIHRVTVRPRECAT